MQLLIEVPSEIETLSATVNKLGSELTSLLTAEASNVIITAQSELSFAGGTKLYRLTDGVVRHLYAGRLIFCSEPGDLIGPEQIFAAGSNFIDNSKAATEFAVTADVYSVPALYAAASEDLKLLAKWTEYLSARSQLLLSLLGSQIASNVDPNHDVRFFSAGDTIIREGEKGDDLYTLLEGEAEVLVRGAVVGKVDTEEIFGAIATLTGSPRIATVVAKSDCMVLVHSKDHILQLIRTRPTIIERLVSDLANKISTLNDQVIEMKGKPEN